MVYTADCLRKDCGRISARRVLVNGTLFDADTFTKVRRNLRAQATKAKQAIHAGIGSQIAVLRSREAHLLSQVDAALRAQEDLFIAELTTPADNSAIGSRETIEVPAHAKYGITFKHNVQEVQQAICKYGLVEVASHSEGSRAQSMSAESINSYNTGDTEANSQCDEMPEQPPAICQLEMKSAEPLPPTHTQLHQSQRASEWLAASPEAANGSRQLTYGSSPSKPPVTLDQWLANRSNVDATSANPAIKPAHLSWLHSYSDAAIPNKQCISESHAKESWLSPAPQWENKMRKEHSESSASCHSISFDCIVQHLDAIRLSSNGCWLDHRSSGAPSGCDSRKHARVLQWLAREAVHSEEQATASITVCTDDEGNCASLSEPEEKAAAVTVVKVAALPSNKSDDCHELSSGFSSVLHHIRDIHNRNADDWLLRDGVTAAIMGPNGQEEFVLVTSS